jgi:hypothetical protein
MQSNTNVIPLAERKAERTGKENDGESGDLNKFLSDWPGAKVDIAKVTDNKLLSWVKLEDKNTRSCNRVAYHLGRVLIYRKKHRPEGEKVKAWEMRMESVVGKADRTLRLYMRIAKLIDENPATALPEVVLDRPLRDVPRALRNIQDGRDANYEPDPVEPSVDEKVKRWKKRVHTLLKEAEHPDLQSARDEFLKGWAKAKDDSTQQETVAGAATTDKEPQPTAESKPSGNLVHRYQPKRFEDVVGNTKSVETLRAFAKAKSGGGVLISGPTGTGKTTLAELCAHSFICEGERPRGFEPCGVCEACTTEVYGYMDGVYGRDIAVVPAAAMEPGKAADEVICSIHRGVPVIVNEADRLMTKGQHKLIHVLEGKLKAPVFFATVYPERVDGQFLGRCLQIETRAVTDKELAAHLGKTASMEGKELDDKQAATILRRLKERDSAGLIRNALNELELWLLTAARS